MQATGTQTRRNGFRALRRSRASGRGPPREGARARRRLLPRPVQGFHALLPALAVALGCGGQPFPGSSASLDELGRAALEAFSNDDREALEALRLSETEHNTRVWPELPAARGESPFPIDLAWRNIQLRNRRAVSRASAVLAAAQPIEFESVECIGETQVFDTFVVHTDCHTRFRTRGTLYRIQLFKDVLERSGGFKIFRYYDEDPELVTGAGWPDDGKRSRGEGA